MIRIIISPNAESALVEKYTKTRLGISHFSLRDQRFVHDKGIYRSGFIFNRWIPPNFFLVKYVLDCISRLS